MKWRNEEIIVIWKDQMMVTKDIFSGVDEV